MESFEFDRKIREQTEQEPFPLPEGYAERVLQTCEQLKASEKVSKNCQNRRKTVRWAGWIAAVLALCIAVPNVSPTAAAAMEDVPLLGALVRIVTFQRQSYDDGHVSADVETPVLAGSDAAESVSEDVQTYTAELLEQFQADCADVGEGYQSLDVSSSVVTDSETWFTLRVDALEISASGYEFSRFYHIDKTTGDIVTLADLFRPEADYVSVLSAEVRRQMEEQMAQDETAAYFPEEFTAIDPNQNFYWNEDGDLALVFDEYTIAAGVMGMPEFTIPASVYQTLLK